jgi:hypothetical protein
MPVRVDTALYHQKKLSKAAKADKLSTMVHYLLGKCPVCWARTGQYDVVKTQSHTYFLDCNDTSNPGYTPNANGWWGLKKMLHFQSYEYCFRCGLPQGDYMPTSHPPFMKGRRLECPLEDFVAVLCWFVFTNASTYKAARQAFPGLKSKMLTAQFADWANQTAGDDSFYNGLELVIWMWEQLQGYTEH